MGAEDTTGSDGSSDPSAGPAGPALRAQLHRLDLVDVTLTNCDLAGVVFEDASFNRVALVGCRLKGADLGRALLADLGIVVDDDPDWSVT